MAETLRLFLLAAAAIVMGAYGAGGGAAAKEFRYADQRSLSSMEPYFNNVFPLTFLNNIYETLIAVDNSGDLVPQLATRWEAIAPDRWRFELRQGVKFQDGEDFTADDVIFSIKRAMSKTSTLTSPFKTLQDVIKIDDHTIEITTKVPDPNLARNFNTLLIMSKQWCEQNNAVEPADRTGKTENYATRHANGTGPFILREWVPNVSVTMDVNPNWWGGKRKDQMTSAKYFEIGDSSTQLAALLSNETDMITSLSPALTGRVQSSPDLKLVTGQGAQTLFFFMDQFNTELHDSDVKGKNPFKDKRVRQAIYDAIDVDAIVSKIMRGQAFPSNLAISKYSSGFAPEFNVREKADPAKARQLLAAAGYPKGFEIPIECTISYYQNDQAICTAVQAMLAQVGIKGTLVSDPPTIFFTKTQYPKFAGTFYIFASNAANYDGASTLCDRLHTRDVAHNFAMQNTAGYSNPELDKICDDISNEFDQSKRKEMMKKLLSIVVEEKPMIPLFQTAVLWALRKNVDAVPDPLNRVLLKDVTLN